MDRQTEELPRSDVGKKARCARAGLRAAERARARRLTDLGATLVAISPQTPDNSLSTVEKNQLEFEVLSDPDGATADAYGLAFEIPQYLRDIYETFGHPLPKFNGEGHNTIPVPGTVVLDQEATARYRFVDADYTRRADPAGITSAVAALRA
jgi:peroxiredoxin